MPNNGPFYAQGRYLCEIVDHGLTTAGTGTVQAAIKFRVIEGTQPEQEVTQYERTAYLPITEKTMQYLVPKLASLGIDSLKQLKKGGSDYRDLAGTHVEMFCKHEPQSEGQPREKWDVAQSQSKPLELKAVDDKALRNLDMLFGKELKNSGSVGAPKPQAVKAPATAAAGPDPNWGEIGDDDLVPF
jgi:hypothetical protein